MFSPIYLIGNLAMTQIAASIFALVALTIGTSQSMTGGSVAASFRGEWVPASTACNSPHRLIIEPNVITFVKGTDRAVYRKLDQCFSCMGRDVENITLLTTDQMGDSPFIIYLDGSKKKPSITVDFGNDKKLGTRFSFGTAALKKCK